MLVKRIIPCLDVNRGRVVKGVNFIDLKDAGDPVELAKFYNDEGADELVFLDITASYENREIIIDIVRKVARQIFIPFTVGGGIRSVRDIKKILLAGADKVSLNTSAVTNPEFITEAANVFGSQCIVVAIDAVKRSDGWEVVKNSGTKPTGLDVLSWAKKATERGAGEILLTSIDCDGTRKGYDIELVRRISESVKVPVVASGGAGKIDDFVQIFREGKADAALAASLFHFNRVRISSLKERLQKNQILIRN
ncbi:imidazole glycerol phosphate synthase subunit HisF [Candidatus Gottesmanbacteria bacterium RIFCSPLOWO2_01_FULL_39_12b]|uniref:Imidazole glycerol phosphate synthase subunit HisF n=1 Tax=Candidatus Gottesmanbacteria bacterium RIFCSPLOWO2_01_FULL_39_12b TaxID=1798388 RepID=A0A1F6ARR5_9BACT|nr:MAG: imidazole glycerol phosphate synthase subunit HisF [Candidatus Gottesmanbacteria bacterium RIFCSPLOWO2_01_FULL_39_12b]